MRKSFYGGNPKTRFLKGFKNFDRKLFEGEFSYSLQPFQLLGCTHSHDVFILILESTSQFKTKCYR